MAIKDSTCVLPHTCVTCGALFTPLKFRKRERVFRAYTGRQNCSAECAFKAKGEVTAKRMKETRDQWIGPNNPMWTGSCLRKNKSYRGADWAQLAESARKRDKYTCQCCGITNDEHVKKCGKFLAVHHIIPFAEFTDHVKANRLSNLTTLCNICHATADRAVKGRQLILDLSDGKQKRKKSLKPRPLTSAATKLKISIANKGKFVSAETRAKQSAARIGVRLSDETRQKLKASNIGKKHTEETKQKIRKAHEGKIHSKEWIANYVVSRLKSNEIKKVAQALKGSGFVAH